MKLNQNNKLLNAWIKLNDVLQNEEQPETVQQQTSSMKVRPMTAQHFQHQQKNNNQSIMNHSQFHQFKPSQVSSIKSLLNLKAQARPHSKNGTDNPRVVNKDIQVLNQLDIHEFHNLENQTEKINNVNVDLILDLYTAKCKDIKSQYIPQQAVKFVEKFKQNCSNEKLILNQQNFKNNSAKVLNLILNENTELIYIDLSKNNLSDVGVGILVQALKEKNNIIHLDLSSNNITYSGSQMIFSLLENNHNLISLNLSSSDGLNRNRLGNKSIECLENILADNHIIQFLNLSGTGIEATGVRSILQGLYSNKTLAYLNISNNQMGPSLGDVLELHMKYNQIIELDISSNNIQDHGIITFSNYFSSEQSDKSMQILNVKSNQLSSYGVSKLLDSISRKGKITKLVLDDNDLSGKGISTLSSYLTDNVSLNYLSMNNCELTVDGCEYFASGLQRNSSLEEIYLNNNYFKESGGKHIANALAVNETLKTLEMGMCRFSDQAGYLIAQSLKFHKTLINISMKENNLKDKSGLSLSETIKLNGNIKKLDLQRNPISYRFIIDINKGIKQNIQRQKQSLIPNFQKQRQELINEITQVDQIENEAVMLQEEEELAMNELQQQQQLFNEEMKQQNEMTQKLEEEYMTYLEEIRSIDKYKQDLDNDIRLLGINSQDEQDQINETIYKLQTDINYASQNKRKKTEQFQVKKKQFELIVEQLRKEQQEMSKKAARLENLCKGFEQQVDWLVYLRFNNRRGSLNNRQRKRIWKSMI